MNKRIALIGTHGVGKTTLLNSISHPYKLQELARQHLIGDIKPSDMTASDRIVFQRKYWQLQLDAENEKKDTGFLSDRSLLDIIAYSYGFFASKDIKSMLNQVISRYDYLFYIPIEFPLEVDKIRNPSKKYQQLIDDIIFNLIQHLSVNDNKVKVITLEGSVEQRVQQFNKIINNATQ